jgi:hypothetical protein
MSRLSLIALALIPLAACADQTGQSMNRVTVGGQTYDIVTQTFRDTSTGQRFGKSEVLVAGFRETCNPNVTGDCADAVRYVLERTGKPSNYPRRTGSDKYLLPG